jgi:hypothetical protein
MPVRDVRRAALQRSDHVMQRGRPQRGHHTNRPGQQRQRALAAGIKQPLGLELVLELDKTLEQIALPGLLHGLDDQLQFAARLVDAKPAAHLDQLAVARRKVEQTGRTAKHGAADLPLLVFQRKITVPTRGTREAGEFSLHRHRVEARFQAVGNGAQQRTHWPDTHTRPRPGCRF